jgi:hypothetical protein
VIPGTTLITCHLVLVADVAGYSRLIGAGNASIKRSRGARADNGH